MNEQDENQEKKKSGSAGGIAIAAMKLARDHRFRIFPLYGIKEPGVCACGCADPSCASRGKHPREKGWQDSASNDPDVVRAAFSKHPCSNIGVLSGGGDGPVVIDVDRRKGGQASFDSLTSQFPDLAATLTVTTGDGFHLYFGCAEALPSRTDLRPGIDVKGDGGYIVGPGSTHFSGATYQVVDVNSRLQALPSELKDEIARQRPARRDGPAEDRDRFFEGVRNHSLFKVAALLRSQGLSTAGIRDALGAVNTVLCVPTLAHAEVEQIANSVGRYPVDLCEDRTKDPFDRPAFTGMLGEVAHLLVERKHTEADPLALLGTLMTMFGWACSPGPHMLVGSTRHEPRLFLVLVGDTAKARKGESWQTVHSLMTRADPSIEFHTGYNFATGEGLIKHLQTRKDESLQSVIATAAFDNPANAARAKSIVHIPEFAQVMVAKGRRENTLGTVLRQAWDGTPLEVNTRADPLRVRHHCLSVVANVTGGELLRTLPQNDLFNGFANRFLWLCVRSTASIPFPEPLEGPEVEKVVDRLKAAIDHGRGVGRIEWSAAARPAWEAEYPRLKSSRSGDGGVDAAIGRAEPMVIRIALVYALADRSSTIEEPHLRAALDFWEYCCHGAFHAFADRRLAATAGDAKERLMDAIASDPGCSRSDLYRLVGITSAAALDEHLDTLAAEGRIRHETPNRGARGRPVTRYYPIG